MKNLKVIFAIAAICVIQATALGGTHAFPSDDSTVVGSIGFIDADEIGWFWTVTRGDLVSETFADPLSFVTRAVFDFEVPRNVLNSGAQVDWDVLINGTTVGAFTIVQGFTGAVNVDLSFAPVANVGGEYTLVFEVTNIVPGGYGSHTLGYDTPTIHSVQLTAEQSTDLIADGGSPATAFDVGDVTIVNDGTDLVVTMTIDLAPWEFAETHLHIAGALEDIPQTKKGNARPGKFDYDESDAATSPTEHVYTIALADLGLSPGDTAYVAAHAAIEWTETTPDGDILHEESAWADGPEIAEGADWAMYVLCEL